VKRSILFRWGFLVVLLIPITVTSTMPAIPWWQFLVYGELQREDEGALQNFPVRLFGKYPRSSWKPLGGCRPDFGGLANENSIGLTNANGRFGLRVYACYLPDTIAVGVLLPDTVILGAPIVTKRLRSWPQEAGYEYEEDGFFCDDTKDGAWEGTEFQRIDDELVILPAGIVQP